MTKLPRWSREEVGTLRRLFRDGATDHIIASRVGRTTKAVTMKRVKLHLHRGATKRPPRRPPLVLSLPTGCPCCGHCGQPLPTNFYLPPMQRRYYDIIKRFPGLTRQRLIALAYADDPDGGPLKTPTIANLRRRLKPHGLTVRSTGGHGEREARYFIEPIGR